MAYEYALKPKDERKGPPPPLPLPWLAQEIISQYQEWDAHGTSPARHSGGRGSQNPRLLAAFSRLRAVEARARAKPQGSPS